MRLRQTDRTSKGAIAGSVYDKNVKRFTAVFSHPTEAAFSAQSVYDTYPHQKISMHRNVPPLNPVQMSKISKPGCEDVVKYVAENASAKYSLSGDNLASALVSRSSVDEFQPYRSNDFTTVRTDVASYLYQRALSRASTAEYDFGPLVGEIAETAALLASPLRAFNKLSTKVFDGVTFLSKHRIGEHPRVVFRVAKNASRKAKETLYDASVKHPFNTSLRIADESANHWLAYKFGVCPILDDISKIQQFYEKNVRALMGVRCVRLNGWKTNETKSRLDKGTIWYNFSSTLFRVRREEDRHSFGLYFKNNAATPFANFMESLGFSQFAVPVLAYELLPLSFVVDRFIDIKSFIRGNLGGLNKQFLGYYCSRKVTVNWSFACHDLKYGYPVKVPCTASKALLANATSQRLARVVNLDRPNFPVINPYWRQQLEADATNLSLIWGRLRNLVGGKGERL